MTAELPGELPASGRARREALARLEQAQQTPDNPGNTPDNPAHTPDNPADSPETAPAELDETLDEAAEEAAPDQNAATELPGAGELAPAEADDGLNPGLRAAALAGNGQIRRTYDWTAIRRRYVEGVRNGDEGVTEWPSLDAVAEHFGAAPNRVREMSAKEGWRGQRAQWQAQLEATRRQAKAAAMSKEATALDGRALDAAKMGLQLAIARLAEIGQQAQRARSDAGVGGAPAGVIDAQEQQRLAQAVDRWHKIGLRAVGDPETHRVEITGANGAPLEIAAELRRDDADRLAGVLGVLQQAGLGELFGTERPIVEGEVVEP
jgi:hypothetical protein